MSDTVSKLQQIYNDERNITLTWFWDGGISAVYGDKINGHVADMLDTVEEAVDYLWDQHINYLEKKVCVTPASKSSP